MGQVDKEIVRKEWEEKIYSEYTVEESLYLYYVKFEESLKYTEERLCF